MENNTHAVFLVEFNRMTDGMTYFWIDGFTYQQKLLEGTNKVERALFEAEGRCCPTAKKADYSKF